MRLTFRYIILLTMLLCKGAYAAAQGEFSPSRNDTTYTLAGDTLFTNQDFRVFIGQPIIIGKASGERGWYNTISFKSGASWPLVLMKEAELRQDQEYQLDPSVREKDKVRDYLSSGDTLIVTKIKRLGSKRFGNYWYMVNMGHKKGLFSLNFKCDLINAVRFGEVTLPKW
ncbi:hypothetical protein SAMN05444008_114137 [Cnuella takakiae]|uniref:Uncharacterized protein n=1 Tax=Cnuella takakiae TaxID=1302690 RepID=A0A1M5FT68_9BACT|nr:hypothetical protein [Cnuella takakiae]OLY93653.1 hypothetical protein BUE76_18540 [Cnuella takakiae]SHF94382.1 hypothetical protein SAMN05444008_114137 [Cnuella takakiae]